MKIDNDQKERIKEKMMRASEFMIKHKETIIRIMRSKEFSDRILGITNKET